MVIPLVLAPYLSRTLRETALGIFSYANSIAAYFVTLSMLGIARHGQRIISENANDNIKLRKAFWSLFVVHIIASTISIILYSIFVVVFIKSDAVVFRIEILYVASALFDITWLFYGLENFKSVVIKNTLIKIFECALVFLFVKSPNDLGVYTFINAFSILISQAIMIPQAIKVFRPIGFSKDDAVKHIKPLLIFSISVIASFMYTVFDNIIGQRQYIKYSYFITSFLGMASLFGLIGISDVFSVLYYGESFRICGKIIVYMAPLIYIVGAGDIIRTQYMIPNHMDKQFNICIIFNAIINLILSVLLIPLIGVFGAVAGSVSAEIFGLIVQLFICRRFVKIKEILNELIPFILIGGVMLLCIKYIDNISSISLFGLMSKLLVGIFVYCILTAIYILGFRKDIKDAVINKVNYKNRRSI